MKKYPVIYNNEEYEVRWHRESILCDNLILYKVKSLLFIKIYRRVFCRDEYDVDYYSYAYPLDVNSPTYRIDQVKNLIKLYENEVETTEQIKANKEQQLEELKKWDGRI